MKLAVIGNFDKEISPFSSGGTEVFTYTLVNELAKRQEIENIDVYGVGQNNFSHPKIRFVAILPTPTQTYIDNHSTLNTISKDRSDFLSEFRFNIAIKIFKLLLENQYDLIHDNSTSAIFNGLGSLLKVPVLTTLHTNVTSPSFFLPYTLGLINSSHKNQYYVAIAKHQKKFAEKENVNINIIDTIYNGLDLENILPSFETDKKFLLWVGRISRKHNKGIKEAIQTSTLSNKPLTIITSVDDKLYYETEIKKLLNEKVTFIDQKIRGEEKMNYYRDARCFLYPIIWEEPFGLVFLEALASGTPVIAFARGAVPEIIKDGETGYVVNPSDEDIRGDWIIKKTGLEGLKEAINIIYSLPDEQYTTIRRNCRRHVEENFTIEKMVDGYVEIYKKIIS